MKVGFFILLYCSLSWSQEGLLNKLLAPGPLVKGHAHLENTDCLKCHSAGEGVPDAQCLACHKAITKFVESKRGFHGLATKSCKECHSEHKGADYDSISVDEKNFNHGQWTGYKLEGKHAEIKCVDCHKAKMPATSVRAGKTRYLGVQATCVSCHKKDDVHFFKGTFAKKDCVTCHELKSWKEGLKFEHKKDTGYALEGKHSELKCATCHTPLGPDKKIQKVVYKWPNLKVDQCLSCHQDQHKNAFTKKFQNGNCLTCHQQTDWKIEHFDHNITKYSLRGKHKELRCVECHKQGEGMSVELKKPSFKFKGLSQQCLTCHKDFHFFGKTQQLKSFGRLNSCGACHNESKWQDTNRFNHNDHTRYPIDGEHLKLNCTDCHMQKDANKKNISVRYKWEHLTSKTCENCHKSPHLQQFSPLLLKKSCTECHVTSSWFDTKSGTKFDHSKTKFPLTGAHQKISCNNCHGTQGKQIFKFKSVNNQFCVDCHKSIHNRQFSTKFDSPNCFTCHTTTTFKERLKFDHSKTNYPLEGSHTKLQCAECHKPTSTKIALTPPNTRADPKKTGKTAIFTLSQFLFPQVKKSECLSCHTDYHQEQLGTNCLECHNMDKWRKVQFNHNKQSTFPLVFKHEQVKCSECHKPIPKTFIKVKGGIHLVTQYKFASSTCVTCHKDVHNGEFGAKCQECHTERGWKLTKDFHKNFTLNGVHFSLECTECHQDKRKLEGLSQNCLTCHEKDDVHQGTLPRCQDCHRQQFWEVTGFKHSLTQFPLRGAHRTLDCMECHRSGTYKGLNPMCSSCHLQEALSVPTPVHSGFTNLNNCNECHLNQFSW